MNILLWVLQIGLAFYGLSGGAWLLKTAGKLGGGAHSTLPPSAWMLVGVLQILFALGLVVPGAFGILPGVTAIAAICLAVQMVATAASMHTKRLMSQGMLWAVIPGLLAAFVAYGRWMLVKI